MTAAETLRTDVFVILTIVLYPPQNGAVIPRATTERLAQAAQGTAVPAHRRCIAATENATMVRRARLVLRTAVVAQLRLSLFQLPPLLFQLTVIRQRP